MFGANDTLDEISRYRVFNIFLVPWLNRNKEELLSKIHTKQMYICFFDFSHPNSIRAPVKVESIETMREVWQMYFKRPKIMKKGDSADDEDEEISEDEKEFAGKMFDSMRKQQNLDNKNLFISVIHYAPRGSFCPSIYCFSEEYLTKNTDFFVDYLEVPYKYNCWFNDKVLFSQFSLLNLKSVQDFYEQKKEKVPYIQWNLNIDDTKEGLHFYYNTTQDFEDDFKTTLTPDVIQAHIRANLKKPILVFCVMNYLAPYYLVLEWDSSNRKFISIKTPNDPSLK